MKYFTLSENESILYQSTVNVGDSPVEAMSKKAKGGEVFLTNEHLFLVVVHKRLLREDEIFVKNIP